MAVLVHIHVLFKKNFYPSMVMLWLIVKHSNLVLGLIINKAA